VTVMPVTVAATPAPLTPVPVAASVTVMSAPAPPTHRASILC